MTQSRIVALGLCFAVLAAVSILRVPSADGHPLGNFTINHSTTIIVHPDRVVVHRVLELSEIPAFQVLQDLETDADGAILTDRWANENIALLREAMTLSINGAAIDLGDTEHLVQIIEGDGGLYVLRLEVDYVGTIPEDARGSEGTIEYADSAYADRIGWREVIALGGPGVDLVGSTLPLQSSTNELWSYPSDLSSSPPDVRAATFSFLPGEGSPIVLSADPDHDSARKGNPDSALGRFEDLIAERDLSAGLIVIALLTATAFGAIHALSPGHGKTVVAAYLVGSRGTLAHAALLGLTVTITHTSSVYAIGFVTLYLQQYIVPEDLYPWMTLVSASIILCMGVALLWSRLRAQGVTARLGRALSGFLPIPRPAFAGERGSLALWPSHQHGTIWHEHAAIASESLDLHLHVHIDDDRHQHEHDHDHGQTDGEPHRHGLGQAHSHDIPGQDGEPVTWQRLLGLGIFGGMIPCPSAIVVMLSAIALHRVGFGLVLIVAFSVGLATVLTGIGFLVVWAQRIPFLQRAMDSAERSGGLGAMMVRSLPVVAALLVTLVGAVMTSRALTQL
jgi:ABC-type nickel/cobalt efflux system permease component RcnA